jgi:hypothetical protein
MVACKPLERSPDGPSSAPSPFLTSQRGGGAGDAEWRSHQGGDGAGWPWWYGDAAVVVVPPQWEDVAQIRQPERVTEPSEVHVKSPSLP